MVKVNISGDEQLPAGTYHFLVSEAEVKQTREDAKFPGEDFWNLELRVQDGEHEGRPQFLAVMLPPYETFTLSRVLRATVGQHRFTEEDLQEDSEVDIELDDLIGLEFVATVAPQKKNPDFNQVSRFKAYDPDQWAEADLLPG